MNGRKWEIICLFVIIVVGIFLRTYNFHDWLKFREDQTRDAYLASQVANGEIPWPLVGPYMSYSGDGDHVEANAFHVGPIYYYFQIVSVKIFGDYPDKAAYPDALFGIMSIPLLYYFLRFFLKRNISLGVATLFTLSAYYIEQSRYSWNTHLVPFFVLLFLVSLFKFLEKNEGTFWKSALSLGIALGVGVQLHAIIMVIFLVITFLVFLFSMKNNVRVWKKWVVVLTVFLVLNFGQIVSEIKTGFGNTRALFSFSSSDQSAPMGWAALIKNDVDCHFEANAYFLSSYGSSSCEYDYFDLAVYKKAFMKSFSKGYELFISKVSVLECIAISLFGYFLLFRRGKKEREKSKKYNVRLVILYTVIAFIIMIPLSQSKFNDLRYLASVFFIPYLFLGFFIQFVSEKFASKYALLLLGLLLFPLIFTNLNVVSNEVSVLIDKNRTCSPSRAITLGELEPVVDYMIIHSDDKERIYFGGDKTLRVAYKPLEYLLRKHGVYSVKTNFDKLNPSQDVQPGFIVSCSAPKKDIYPYEKIGNIYVHRVDN